MKHAQFMKRLLVIFLLFGIIHTNAQDPKRFQKEIETLAGKDYCFSPDKELLLFTGSSSVRMWKDVEEAFPGYHVINNGFGGSHFSDLIYYYDKVIAPYQPHVLFVYEGDNDIASNKEPESILKEAKQLISMIRNDLPGTKIVFISPKPSVARWELKEDYKKLNGMLEELARQTKGVEFADVWEAMVDENGKVFTDIFLEDNLHLNEKGYAIWEKVMARHLE
jgi:lysophospholipase L1-like esterase